MEELLSTDIIHKEILDDARRKAGRILKGAEESAAKSAEEWAEKLKLSIAEVKARYDAEINEQKSESKVRLSMDKQRSKLRKITQALDTAARRFFEAARKEDLLLRLETELSNRIERVRSAFPDLDFDNAKVNIQGFDENEARALLKKMNISAEKIESAKDADGVFGALPSIELDTPGVRIRASIEDEAVEILRVKRAEAAEALFG